jgi:hypothetical protein
MHTFANRSLFRRVSLAGGLAACLAGLAGCRDGDGGRIEDFGAGRESADAAPDRAAAGLLRAEVNGATSVARIAPSGFEDTRAAPGHRLVVLDVTVANPTRQPQVFSEGKLVAVDGADERSFGTPVSMLSAGFLTLQVLQPGERVRGRIVYELPQDVPGKLFWSPGSDGPRIAVHVEGGDRAIAAADDAPRSSVLAMPSPDDAGVDGDTDSDDGIEAVAEARGRADDARAEASGAVATGSRAVAGTTAPAQARRDATPAATPSDRRAAARTCNALVVRNDPNERARWQGFFRRECAGLDPPASWGGRQLASTRGATNGDGSRWPPRDGPAYQCQHAWTRVEHMICNDAALSRMDWELARAYASAQRNVDDREMLQRLQDGWRFNVRDACPTRACVEDAYARRINDLNVIAGD